MESIHGRAVKAGVTDSPTCTDCHGEHSIALSDSEDSKVSAAHISATCAECHAAERIVTKYRLPKFAVETYLDSYHGLSMRLGSVTAANCSSCQGKHDILPSGDPVPVEEVTFAATLSQNLLNEDVVGADEIYALLELRGWINFKGAFATAQTNVFRFAFA